MSKFSRKNIHSRRQVKPHIHKHPVPSKQTHHQAKSGQMGIQQENKKKFVILVIIVILAAIPFAMGKYFEFNQPGPYDSGAYVYSAEKILRGATIGTDERPSAQMGTLLVNILGVSLCGFSETGPKLIQGILQAAALILMFIALRKLFGTLPAAVSVIVASVYLSAPLIAKFGNVKEQHMIAFIVMAMSCFVLRQLGGKWWWAALAGAFVVWAPLFKETGTSALAAIGLFVLAQPLLKHRSWKQTASDIGLLVAGAVIVMAPVYVWLLTRHNGHMLPYSFVWKQVVSTFAGSRENAEEKPAESKTDESAAPDKTEKKGLLAKLLPGYVYKSWQALEGEEKKEVSRRVLRYYKLLILPIAMAAGAIAVRIVRLIRRTASAEKKKKRSYERFVLLFTVWWLLDMGFVWVSPRSYEQYYLPLNASAAMLGGYLIAAYTELLANPANKNVWRVVGVIGLFVMIGMSQHIFFGIEKSPHTGISYGAKSRGYAQKFKEAANRRKGAKGYWEVAGEYIRDNSAESDTIYVWGWVPGIYVQAQRLSAVPQAFEGTMHTLSPTALSNRVAEILNVFKKEPPKFIVDTHKSHFPWNRPPLELWPIYQQQILQKAGVRTSEPDKAYAAWLAKNIEPDETLRYEAMKPFRNYVMTYYTIVQRSFGQNVLFERK